MTNKQAHNIGGRQGLIFTMIGLGIAHILMSFIFSDLFWFTSFEYVLNVVIGALTFLANGYIFGRIAGQLILLKKWHPAIAGPLVALLILTFSAFLAGWIGFFQEGTAYIGTGQNPFEDYVLSPVLAVTIFGGLPALLTGVWFGYRIRKLGSGTS